MLPQDTIHLIQRHVTNEEVHDKIQLAVGPHKDHLTVMKRQTTAVWSCLLFIRSGQNILQGTVKGGRRQGRPGKRWEDKIREWTGLEFAEFQKAVENREKIEEIGCEIICGAPTTLAVKGLMIVTTELQHNQIRR